MVGGNREGSSLSALIAVAGIRINLCGLGDLLGIELSHCINPSR